MGSQVSCAVCGRDRHGASDEARPHLTHRIDRTHHGRRGRDTIIDDDRRPAVDGQRLSLTAQTVLEAARLVACACEERLHGCSRQAARVFRGYRLTVARDGTDRKFGLHRMSDFTDDDNVKRQT